jgi:O-antigen biosynthesis protein WbqV
MKGLPRFTPRQLLIVAHDLLATAGAILLTLVMRFEGPALEARLPMLSVLLPGLIVFAAAVFLFFGLHRTKWRFTSLPDLFSIIKAATMVATALLVVDYILLSPSFYGTFFFGKVTILLYWFLEVAALSGSRIAYRHFRYTRTLRHSKISGTNPTLLVGRAADAEVVLRAIESGAVRTIQPTGILSPSRADRGQTIRGIPVLGDVGDIESVVEMLSARGIRIMRIIFTPTGLEREARPESILQRARHLNIATNQLPSLDAEGRGVTLAPVAVEDLLLRPSVAIDYGRLAEFMRGKSIVVTGGGGSIGAEICDRTMTFGAARLLVIENSEPALHAVLEALAAKQSSGKIEGRLADVRDRDRMFELITAFKPDIVFHAAALKHVDLLETDWDEGVKTNIFGSVNVTDAAVESGAAAMVLVSTDKAVEPVSVLGVTKRFAEMYCQALDGDFLRCMDGGPARMRLLAVRFGNVLASTGSVVPKFKAQIAAGGPVTVTHPEMLRYFMTIREACDLVITAASHALGDDQNHVSTYVLNMGQPVKILDLAERMIRLSGLEPNKDVEIVFTGLRPGERLHEMVFARDEPTSEIGVPGIVATKPKEPSVEQMRSWLAALQRDLSNGDRAPVARTLRDAVQIFSSQSSGG